MEKLERLHRNANQCRSLADCALTAEGREVLLEMARDYEDRAATLHATDIDSLDTFGGVDGWLLPKMNGERSGS